MQLAKRKGGKKEEKGAIRSHDLGRKGKSSKESKGRE